VKKGTLTQAQVDAINAAKETAKSAVRAAHDAKRAEFEALIAKTIGLDAAVIKTRLAAGETLGAIAGAKKDALIAALVAEKSKRIDAAVTAGKLTPAQATTMKAGLVSLVTAKVDSTRGLKGGLGKGHKGGKGGHGHKGGMKPPAAGVAPGA
jgi:Spy/CpxP family protein refolding chaperone